MKAFIGAWLAVAVIGWLALGIFGAIFDSMGVLLLVVTLIAALVSVLYSLSDELDDLRKRVERLEAGTSAVPRSLVSEPVETVSQED